MTSLRQHCFPSSLNTPTGIAGFVIVTEGGLPRGSVTGTKQAKNALLTPMALYCEGESSGSYTQLRGLRGPDATLLTVKQ
jgi:hypothetical protein